MIQKAVESLNTGKAADEHGLKSEHFKNSPHSVYIFLETCFKRILDDKTTPDIFKTGILVIALQLSKGYVKEEYCPLSSTNCMSTISWKI